MGRWRERGGWIWAKDLGERFGLEYFGKGESELRMARTGGGEGFVGRAVGDV